jgi:hypothetical protein
MTIAFELGIAAAREHPVRPEVDALLRELVAAVAKVFTTPPDQERKP